MFIKMSPRFIKKMLLVITCMVALPTSGSQETESHNPEVRELEWQELVPDGWMPSIIAPAYDDEASQTVDSADVVPELGNKLVILPGFIKPVVFQNNVVHEFILVPFLEQHVNQHAHLAANQMIYVSLDEPMVVENPFEPHWVMGILSLRSIATDEGATGYSIDKARAEIYKY